MPVKQRNLALPGFTNAVPFRTFARQNWFDIVTQLACMFFALGLYTLCPPIWARHFPVFPGYEFTNAGLKYGQPFLPEFINTWVMAAIAYAVPAVIMGAFGLWGTRCFHDTNAALTGLGYALATSTLAVNIIKVFIGGLRPHFFELCDPLVIWYPPGTVISRFYTAEQICTGDEHRLKEAQMSFPSGHACAVFAGFGFLSLFLAARMKTFGFGRQIGFAQPHKGDPGMTAHWKLIAFVLPLCFAVVLAASKVRDGWHHPIDVIFGACLGSAFAVMAYAMSYQSVWNPATNHLPW